MDLLHDLLNEVQAAAHRIGAHTRRTPVEPSAFLGAETGARVHLKLENLQRTGSFKIRGAMNVLLSLDADQRSRGVVTASTGNHGLGVATGAREIGCSALVFAPRTANASKLETLRAGGAEVRLVGDDCALAEAAAREHARESGRTYISPYNDPLVVAGQGTIGLELAADLESLDAVFVAVGGGGLVSGIGGYLAAAGREVEVIGCSPRNDASMQASLEAGRIVEVEALSTLSDGTAGAVEPGSITFPMCQEVVDEFALVSEEQIASSLRDVIAHHHSLIEGAAAVAVAGLRSMGRRFEGKDVAVVLCGANIDPATLRELL